MSSEKSDTRTRILETAWKLLEAGDGGEVRMADIAKAVGISRQALYLHFPKRADLLVATTKYLDEVKQVDDRLVASRTATSGVERLDAFIEAWGNYIPEIHGVAKALIAMQETDDEARLAWAGRTQAVREGCEAAVAALARDGMLAPRWSPDQATDLLWTLLSVGNWEQLTRDCGWSQADYVDTLRSLARGALVREA
ncbi:TetR/AcrR family transcriptional regulator [Oricola sp.]|uniref:TetR/AcrR family transcriptional regulator n=1 Tax=Oricola sp. TaxID=1979950 RepID=UPI00260096CB|nr:TetR/AcrR family transcriptional regulator [Oricola sp.]MCI5074286.1 TetR/AcrR family transcriptional regulator [Oricola sp.]